MKRRGPPKRLPGAIRDHQTRRIPMFDSHHEFDQHEHIDTTDDDILDVLAEELGE